MIFGLKWNEECHDEYHVVVLLMSLMVLKMKALGSYTELKKMLKREIYRAMCAQCHLICTFYFWGLELIQELFLTIVVNKCTKVVSGDSQVRQLNLNFVNFVD